MTVSTIARLAQQRLVPEGHEVVLHVALDAGDEPQAAGEQPLEPLSTDVTLVPHELAEQPGRQRTDGLAVVGVAGVEGVKRVKHRPSSSPRSLTTGWSLGSLNP